MKKNVYLKPTIKVVKFQQQFNILASSQKSAKGEDFEWDEEY